MPHPRKPGLRLLTSPPAAKAHAERTARPEAAGAELVDNPLYGVAMLKMAMELKKPGAPPLEDVLHAVLSRMSLDEKDFRAFLARNGGLLRAIGQRRR